MGRKDVRSVEYLSDNVYFADIFNASCFQGKKVILPEQLEDANKEMKDSETKKGEEVRHDNVKYWKRGTKLAALVVEDQHNIDFHMVLRNLYAEGLYYRKQWKKKRADHRRAKDLEPGPEFISGMKKEEKFSPAVYLVVHLGEDKWDGPRTLYDLLDLDGENEQLKPLINDYKLNIFDYHDYDNFDHFKSELRVVFEFLRYSDDADALKKVVAAHLESDYNVSEETYQMIAMLTNSEDLLHNKDACENDEGGNRSMCKALQGIKDEGRIQEAIEIFQEWGHSREEVFEHILKKFSLKDEDAKTYMQEYWKEA